MKTILTLHILLLLVAANKASADIYRYISKDGVECYTDAPVNRESVIVIHERRKSRKSVKKTKDGKYIKSPANKSFSKSISMNAKGILVSLPVEGVISSPVGLRYDPIDGMLRNHTGVDIAVPDGTPIKPVAPGIILYSGTRGGYGNLVIIEHEGGMTTLYAHNRANLVIRGDRVDKNTTIALSGSTGRSTGPHLHFEAWLDGQNITAQVLSEPGMVRKVPIEGTVVRKSRPMRKIIMADGTILLTNLPLVHP
ncbi:MAG TPA: M23 family metallopeptidase [Geobacteraceae bacterium]|nr:M23 family metallopeptidase [Geobacteraceae bacterium]